MIDIASVQAGDIAVFNNSYVTGSLWHGAFVEITEVRSSTHVRAIVPDAVSIDGGAKEKWNDKVISGMHAPKYGSHLETIEISRLDMVQQVYAKICDESQELDSFLSEFDDK